MDYVANSFIATQGIFAFKISYKNEYNYICKKGKPTLLSWSLFDGHTHQNYYLQYCFYYLNIS